MRKVGIPSSGVQRVKETSDSAPIMARKIRVDIYSLEIAKPAAAESNILVTEYFILYPSTFCSSEYSDIRVLTNIAFPKQKSLKLFHFLFGGLDVSQQSKTK